MVGYYRIMDEAPKLEKKLYRDPDNATICGICSGIAQYFNWDVLIVRIVFLFFLIFITVPTFIIYIILRLLLPEKPIERLLKKHENTE